MLQEFFIFFSSFSHRVISAKLGRIGLNSTVKGVVLSLKHTGNNTEKCSFLGALLTLVRDGDK